MPILSLLAFCVLCWLSCAARALGGDTSLPHPTAIWSGVVLATNDPHPSQPPPRLRPFAQKLKNIFGYNQFELVGEYSEKMDDPYERWLVPSKDFSLSVRTYNDPARHYPTRVQLFQNHHYLAEFETHLKADSPLFIRGPLYAGGQLVIVLHVVDPSEILSPRPVRPPAVTVNPTLLRNAPTGREKDWVEPTSAVTSPNDRPVQPPPPPQIIPAEQLGPIPVGKFAPGDDSKDIKP